MSHETQSDDNACKHPGGRPLSWIPPPTEQIVEAIVRLGAAAELDNLKGFKGSVLVDVLKDIGFRASFGQQAWLTRQWRDERQPIRAAVMEQEHECPAAAVAKPSSFVQNCSPDRCSDDDVEDSSWCIQLTLSADEWYDIRPSVTPTGSTKMTEWVDLFCRKLEMFEPIARCTLKAQHHIVKKGYRPNTAIKVPGIVWGVLKCTNKCRVRV